MSKCLKGLAMKWTWSSQSCVPLFVSKLSVELCAPFLAIAAAALSLARPLWFFGNVEPQTGQLFAASAVAAFWNVFKRDSKLFGTKRYSSVLQCGLNLLHNCEKTLPLIIILLKYRTIYCNYAWVDAKKYHRGFWTRDLHNHCQLLFHFIHNHHIFS